MRVTALATPGHTFTHLSYALTDAGSTDGDGLDRRSASSPAARCCTAPPGARTCSAPSTPTPWSATSTPRPTGWPTLLPDEAEVFPTHGFGSFCSATQSDATASTIGQEKQANPVLTQDEETYVRELLAGLGAWPGLLRPHGARPTPPAPPRPTSARPALADAAELRRRIEAGEWVVDLRNRTAFAAGHAPRHPELRPRRRLRDLPRLADRLGHPGHPARRDRRGRRRGAARAGPHRHRPPGGARHRRAGGLDRRRAALASRPPPSPTSRRSATTARWSSWTSAAPTSTPPPAIERRGQHPAPRAAAAGSTEVPAGEVWVHCAGGYRASVAASMLDAAGRTLVAIDDSFDNAEKVGLHLVRTRGGVTLAPRRRRRRAHRAQPGRARRRRLDPRRAGAGLRPRARARPRPPPARWWWSASPRSSAPSRRTAPATCCSPAASPSALVAIGGAVAGAQASAAVPEPVLLAAFAVADARWSAA